jgi:hypothetical protein
VRLDPGALDVEDRDSIDDGDWNRPASRPLVLTKGVAEGTIKEGHCMTKNALILAAAALLFASGSPRADPNAAAV